jgi:hypothetical protein
MSKNPGTQDEPMMDGATDDMSDSGTSKLDAADLQEAGRDNEITPPNALGTGGLGDNPLGQSTE